MTMKPAPAVNLSVSIERFKEALTQLRNLRPYVGLKFWREVGEDPALASLGGVETTVFGTPLELTDDQIVLALDEHRVKLVKRAQLLDIGFFGTTPVDAGELKRWASSP